MNQNIPQIFTPLITELIKLPFPVSLTNHEEHYVFVNPAFEHTYGYTLAELRGRDARVLHRGARVNEEVFKDVHKGTLNGGWSGQLINATRTGKHFRIGLRTFKLTPADLRDIKLTPDGITQNIAPPPISPDTIFLGVACEAGAEEARDRVLIEQFLKRYLMAKSAVPALDEALLAQLTPRRRQAYEMLQEGHSYKDIAYYMDISYATVSVVMSELRKHFGEKYVPRLRREK